MFSFGSQFGKRKPNDRKPCAIKTEKFLTV